MENRSLNFFDAEGVFAKTSRLILRKPQKKDVVFYVETFDDGLRRAYSRDDKNGLRLREGYWDDICDGTSLFVTIVENDRVCGFCCIEKLDATPTEIGIRLRPVFRGNGIGTEAVAAFIDGMRRMVGPADFIAKIGSDNTASQRLFRKLGFVPAGISTFIIKDPDFLHRFEESHLDLIDDHTRALAKEFGVEPRMLLSHVLVFRLRASQE